jgi:hypothetical protein
MLETLELVERRKLSPLPEPRAAIREKMLAVAALIDVPLDTSPHRTTVLPTGCWWLPQARLALYGTACRPPLMLDEVREISRATALDGIVVRYDDTPQSAAPVTLDVWHEGAWHLRHVLWISGTDNAAWLLRDLGGRPYLRLSQWGVELYEEPPYRDPQDRANGIRRGAQHLASPRRC